MSVEIRFDDLHGGTPMRGVAHAAGPELEYAQILHDAGDGTFMVEHVYRAVPPPEPAPSPPTEPNTETADAEAS